MRAERGFSLLELGIAVAAIAILIAALGATTSGAWRAARSERTGSELASLARATADALKRDLVVQPPPGAGLPPTYAFNVGGLSIPLDNAAPLCFDLTRRPGGSRRCPANDPKNTTDGADWSGFAAQELPANSPILEMLGGQMQNNGFNPWCEPYVACLYPRRAEVLTCVPPEELNSAGLSSAGRCGACATPSPLTGEATVCVLASVPAFSQAQARLRLSYSDMLMFDLPNFIDR